MKVCRKCGNIVDTNDEYCAYCGCKTSKSKSFKSRKWIFTLIVGILIIGTISGFCIYENQTYNDKKEKIEQSIERKENNSKYDNNSKYNDTNVSYDC